MLLLLTVFVEVVENDVLEEKVKVERTRALGLIFDNQLLDAAKT